MLRKQMVFLLILLLLLAACAGDVPETVVVTRVVTETETVVEEEAAPAEEAEAEGETVEVETEEEVYEEIVVDVEATGSERDGGQLPGAPARVKVAGEREQTAVFDPTTDEPRAETNPTAPLTAGEIDDNEQWDDYLAYLDSYNNDNIVPIDVRQRHQIMVQDGQGNPVLDAQLSIGTPPAYALLRTHSDGTALFFPAAYEEQAESYEIIALANGSVARGTLSPTEPTIITLNDYSRPPALQLDIAFLLDATGSMGDEIGVLKANIQRIVNEIVEVEPDVQIRLGMVAYRDEGDDFVTRPFSLTADVGAFTQFLSGIEADGGGDYPEAVTPALWEMVNRLSWRDTPTVRLAFLIADAPPHVGVADNPYALPLLKAAEQGIKIYPLASSGLDAQGEYIFRQLAQFTNGRFLFLTDPAGEPAAEVSVTTAGQNYTVAALDELIINIIREELEPLIAAGR